MDAQRVEVFHTSYGETMVIRIADDLELDFFPTFQGFFHQDLRCESKGTTGQFDETFLVRTDAATQTA